MRLINYGAGEITDRLTILALKILTGAAAGKETAHFENERSSLMVKLAARTLNGSWFAQVLELGAVNAALWYAEDALRGWRSTWAETGPDSSGLSGGPGSGYKTATAAAIVALAFRIQDLNDQRAVLVEAINKLAGDHIASEKLT
jgi:hypothetical protein